MVKKKKVSKILKKLQAKDILKKSQATVTIKEQKPAEYVPVYFQAEINEEKKKLFFS